MIEQVGYYLDPFSALIEAVYRAEGGTDATMIKAVRCSFPETKTLEQALCRLAKTIRNRVLSFCEFSDKPLFQSVRTQSKDPWTNEDRPRRLRVSDEFIAFLGARWAPIGALNDPTGLNANWISNVQRIYATLIQEDGDGDATRGDRSV